MSELEVLDSPYLHKGRKSNFADIVPTDSANCPLLIHFQPLLAHLGLRQCPVTQKQTRNAGGKFLPGNGDSDRRRLAVGNYGIPGESCLEQPPWGDQVAETGDGRREEAHRQLLATPEIGQGELLNLFLHLSLHVDPVSQDLAVALERSEPQGSGDKTRFRLGAAHIVAARHDPAIGKQLSLARRQPFCGRGLARLAMAALFEPSGGEAARHGPRSGRTKQFLH